MFAGTQITLGDKEYTIPPLSLGQLRNGCLELLKKHDELVAKGDFWETLEYRGKIIHAALKRNYPDITEQDVFDMLDITNSTPVFMAVIGASGFAPGEAEAARVNGISSPSTDLSPLPTDGPTGK